MRIRKFAAAVLALAVTSCQFSPKNSTYVRHSVPAHTKLAPFVEVLLRPELAQSAPLAKAGSERVNTAGGAVDELIRAYAPRIWFHSEEPYGPTDPVEFIKHSSLWLKKSSGSSEKIASKGSVEFAQLGSLGGAGNSLYARTDTKFWGGLEAMRAPAGLVKEAEAGASADPENYFLKYDGPLSPDVDQAPILWRLGLAPSSLELGRAPAGQERVLLEYWYHLPYSRVGSFKVGNHEGDWEGMAMLIDLGVDDKGALTHKLVAAYYAAHSEGQWFCPSELSFEGTHPEAFSAKGTHATYAKAGAYRFFPIQDHTGRGRNWDTWKNMRPMALEPYYGFAGRWGDVSVLPHSSGPFPPGAPGKWLPNPNSAARKLQKCI